jgi:hypothetical protein
MVSGRTSRSVDGAIVRLTSAEQNRTVGSLGVENLLGILEVAVQDTLERLRIVRLVQEGPALMIEEKVKLVKQILSWSIQYASADNDSLSKRSSEIPSTAN